VAEMNINRARLILDYLYVLGESKSDEIENETTTLYRITPHSMEGTTNGDEWNGRMNAMMSMHLKTRKETNEKIGEARKETNDKIEKINDKIEKINDKIDEAQAMNVKMIEKMNEMNIGNFLRIQKMLGGAAPTSMVP